MSTSMTNGGNKALRACSMAREGVQRELNDLDLQIDAPRVAEEVKTMGQTKRAKDEGRLEGHRVVSSGTDGQGEGVSGK
jgi:hypothetical protein